MPRYFLEVAYKGTHYSGFQVQLNANSIQAEIEKALEVYFRRKFELTCSSRTDAGVHAMQNYFHFDTADLGHDSKRSEYHLNSILPDDIVIKNIIPVNETAHARFDALSREYSYHISRVKDPFLRDRSYHFPYKIDLSAMQEAAGLLMNYQDFTSFSKRNTQVKSFICNIIHSRWVEGEHGISYQVQANRFLRGMVRGLTGTMLQVGRGKIGLDEFTQIIEERNAIKAKFDVPAQGLFLVKVNYPESIFKTGKKDPE